MLAEGFELPLDPFQGRGQRTAGIHLTDVISYLERVKGQTAPNYEGWEEAALVGLLWEDAVSQALTTQFHRSGDGGIEPVGELEHDGVLLTPDGYDPVEDAVWEFKATWKSSRTAPEEVWRYLVQLKAYCHVLGTRVGKLVVLYVCGDYQRPQRPQRVGRRLTFSAQELEENWRMIVGGARVMKERRGRETW